MTSGAIHTHTHTHTHTGARTHAPTHTHTHIICGSNYVRRHSQKYITTHIILHTYYCTHFTAHHLWLELLQAPSKRGCQSWSYFQTSAPNSQKSAEILKRPPYVVTLYSKYYAPPIYRGCQSRSYFQTSVFPQILCQSGPSYVYYTQSLQRGLF